MHNNNIPTDSELPSVAKLIKSTVLATILAAIILLTGVLPAEYGIDPTGIGKMLGLSQMGKIKVSLAQDVAAEKTIEKGNETTEGSSSIMVSKAAEKNTSAQQQVPLKTDTMTISLKPNEGKEIKLKMNKGEKVTYVWWTSNGRANFDIHADSKKLQINYRSYGKGSTDRKQGVMEAAFDGKHGWFWRNRTSEPMTITLEVKGEYSDIKQEV